MIFLGDSGAWTAADTQPTIYEIFVGYNKAIDVEFYKSAGRTGDVVTEGIFDTIGGIRYGANTAYDPSTGVVTGQSATHTRPATGLDCLCQDSA